MLPPDTFPRGRACCPYLRCFSSSVNKQGVCPDPLMPEMNTTATGDGEKWYTVRERKDEKDEWDHVPLLGRTVDSGVSSLDYYDDTVAQNPVEEGDWLQITHVPAIHRGWQWLSGKKAGGRKSEGGGEEEEKEEECKGKGKENENENENEKGKGKGEETDGEALAKTTVAALPVAGGSTSTATTTTVPASSNTNAAAAAAAGCRTGGVTSCQDAAQEKKEEDIAVPDTHTTTTSSVTTAPAPAPARSRGYSTTSLNINASDTTTATTAATATATDTAVTTTMTAAASLESLAAQQAPRRKRHMARALPLSYFMKNHRTGGDW